MTSKLLTAEEEVELISLAQDENASQRKRDQARNKLMVHNERFVRFIANPIARRYGIESDDLVQVGYFGLMIAIDKFDLSTGNRFSTYAGPWIRQQIQLYVKDTGATIRKPVYVTETKAKINKAREQLFDDLGRVPSDQEVADYLEIDVSKIAKFEVATLQTASLDFQISEDSTYADVIQDENAKTPDEVVAEKELVQLISEALKCLSEQEEFVLRQRNGFGVMDIQTLESISNRLGVSKERVRQIQETALAKLRKNHIVKTKLKSFLIPQ